MASRPLLLDSADWPYLESRWNIAIEDYHCSVGSSESATPFSGQAYAVYGDVPQMGRVLFFVVSRLQTTLYADELIETCLNELDPSLALELKRDIGVLLKLLCFSSCEVVTRLNNRKRATS